MDALVTTDYTNTKVVDGFNNFLMVQSCDSSIKAIKRIHDCMYNKIESVEITFTATVSPALQPIGLTDEFWLSVALEEYV